MFGVIVTRKHTYLTDGSKVYSIDKRCVKSTSIAEFNEEILRVFIPVPPLNVKSDGEFESLVRSVVSCHWARSWVPLVSCLLGLRPWWARSNTSLIRFMRKRLGLTSKHLQPRRLVFATPDKRSIQYMLCDEYESQQKWLSVMEK